jgi:hypothetical protein
VDRSSRDEDQVWQLPGASRVGCATPRPFPSSARRRCGPVARPRWLGIGTLATVHPGHPWPSLRPRLDLGRLAYRTTNRYLPTHTFQGPWELGPWYRCARSGNHLKPRGSCPARRATNSHMTQSSGILGTSSEAGITHFLRHNRGLPSACDQAVAAVILPAFHETRSA